MPFAFSDSSNLSMSGFYRQHFALFSASGLGCSSTCTACHSQWLTIPLQAPLKIISSKISTAANKHKHKIDPKITYQCPKRDPSWPLFLSGWHSSPGFAILLCRNVRVLEALRNRTKFGQLQLKLKHAPSTFVLYGLTGLVTTPRTSNQVLISRVLLNGHYLESGSLWNL